MCYTPEDGSNVILDHDNNAGCPIAFHKIGDKCYFYGYFKLNWFRAMEFCHSFGSSVSLACIESPQENDYLKNWLIEYGEYCNLLFQECESKDIMLKSLDRLNLCFLF